MIDIFKETYEYRELLRNLVNRDLRTRYKGSALGFLWTFLNPLLQLAIYSVVFSFIMRIQVENYTGFLFVALLPWFYFSTSTSTANSLIIGQASIIKKIYFPRFILPLSSAISGLINLCLSFLVAVPVMIFLGGQPLSPYLLFLPVILILQGILVLGMVLLISSLNVYFRDLEHLWGILLQGWMYLTPILYPLTMVPEKYRDWFYLNPMTAITLLYRDVLHYGKVPDNGLLLQASAWALAIGVVGFLVFQKLSRRFAEEI